MSICSNNRKQEEDPDDEAKAMRTTALDQVIGFLVLVLLIFIAFITLLSIAIFAAFVVITQGTSDDRQQKDKSPKDTSIIDEGVSLPRTEESGPDLLKQWLQSLLGSGDTPTHHNAPYVSSIKEWLSICDTHHAGTCVETNSNTPCSTRCSARPSRLIDIKNQCIVRGIDTQGAYLALSYTWGRDAVMANGATQLQLLNCNVNALESAESLKQRTSKVIRDAMEWTAAIGKRYLWVDRLCIIQDDPDKGVELMRMDQIYSGAYLTIVAAADHGLYSAPDDTMCNHGMDHLGQYDSFSRSENWSNWEHSQAGQDSHIMANHKAAALSRWGKRAWTYQEEILSHRVVFFLGDRIFWQCERATWDMNLLRPKQGEENTSLPSSMSSLTTQLSAPKESDFSLYVDMICPYNGRELTNNGDGLWAISGILNRLLPAFPDGFLFGMPKRYLDYALLWQPLKWSYEHSHRPLKPVDNSGKGAVMSTRRETLPSWAWCGWQCYVEPESFAPALAFCQDDRHARSSWKLQSIVAWEYEGSLLRGSARPDDSPDDCAAGLLSQWQPSYMSASSATVNHISASTTHAFFFPAATLVLFPGPRRQLEAATPNHKHNSVLNERPLFEMARVVVLRDPRGRFAGLLRITGDLKCERGKIMDLVAISRGSASGRDLYESFEETVFRSSRSRTPTGFNVTYPNTEFEKDVPSGWRFIHGRQYQARVIEGEYEEMFQTPEIMYKFHRHYEFYNVLWVQKGDDGVAYRAGCGRVHRDCWERNNPSPTRITLS